MEEATQEFYEYQREQALKNQMLDESDDEEIGRYEALFGQKLDKSNPLLSPKMYDLIR